MQIRSVQQDLQREMAVYHAEICQAMADSTRIALLYELADGPQNVSQLVDALGQPQPTVSRHLATLRERGILRAERKGSHVYYSLADERLVQVLDLFREVMGEILATRSRLARALQEEQERRSGDQGLKPESTGWRLSHQQPVGSVDGPIAVEV